MLLWFARGAQDYDVETHPEGQLFRFTREPAGAEWYRQGRIATRREVLDSIESGLPILREASAQDGSEAMLEAWTKRAMRLLPA
jgi:hypothetical protein